MTIAVGAVTGFTTTAASTASIALTSVEHFDTHLSSNRLHKLATASAIIGFSQMALAPLSVVPLNMEASAASTALDAADATAMDARGAAMDAQNKCFQASYDVRYALNEVRVISAKTFEVTTSAVTESHLANTALAEAIATLDAARNTVVVTEDAATIAEAVANGVATTATPYISLRYYSVLPTVLTIGAGIWFGTDALKYHGSTTVPSTLDV